MTPVEFAEALAEKFPDYIFHASKGIKWHRISMKHEHGMGWHVHCFIGAIDGSVYKAESWKAPAKGARYNTMEEALKHADASGSYLYAKG